MIPIPVDRDTLKLILDTITMLVGAVQTLAKKDELTPEQEAALRVAGDDTSKKLHELLEDTSPPS